MATPERSSPAARHPAQPSQKPAIWALCLALFSGCCFYIPAVVAAVLAFKVLNRSDWERRDHGRALAVTALGVAAFQVGSLVVALVLYLGTDSGNLGSGRYGAPPSNADASIVPISELAVRDCFDDPGLRGRRGPLRQVACGDPHDGEVVESIQLVDSGFPGSRALHRQARACRAAFGDYFGTALARSELEMSYYYPTRSLWADRAAREITCVVVDPEGPLERPAWQAER